MKRSPLAVILSLALLLVVASCGREGRIIPRRKLAKIYAEMFVADAWLTNGPQSVKVKADTTAFYEPIFNAYGYTTEDYLASVSHYLLDPDRYSRILKRTEAILGAEIEALRVEIDRERQALIERNNRASRRPKYVFELYDTLFTQPTFTDRIDMHRDSTGRYFPMRVTGDTMFFGPRLIIPADSLLTSADSLSVSADSLAVEGLSADD